MEFNKLAILNLFGNLAENFKMFHSELKIYFTATGTGSKSKEEVARLKNLMGSETLQLYTTFTTLKMEEEINTDYIIKSLFTEKERSSRDIQVFYEETRHGRMFESHYADLQRLVKSCQFGDQEQKPLKA